MRYVNCVLMLSLFSVLSAGQTGARSAADFQSTVHLFDYDAKQPLNIHDKIIEESGNSTLHDITYTSPKGGPVGAYLVVPKGKGPFAAVLFGHWGNGTRAEFIPEAKIYANAGAISLLPDYPWDRPQPWRKHLTTSINRRWAAKPTFKLWWIFAEGSTCCFHGPTSIPSGHILLRNQDPGFVEFRKNQPAGQLEKYAQVMGDMDAIHFVGHAAPVPLLLQFANYEQYFDKTSRQHYFAAASEPKKVLYYETDHDLNDPQALQDRYEWLIKYVNLRPASFPLVR